MPPPVCSAANSNIIAGVGGNVYQCVAVLNVCIGIVYAVKGEIAVLHLAIGGKGIDSHHVIFICVGVQRRQLHKGIGVLHCQCVGGRSHIAFQITVISKDNASHQAAHPNIGGVSNTNVRLFHRRGGDRAAGIALIQRGPAHTGDAAHTQVLIPIIIRGTQYNVRHGGAAGDVHIGRAHQAAHAAAAPVRVVGPCVLNGIAGHGAVGKGRIVLPRTGKAHQTAHGVPARAVLVIDDLAALVGIHDDVLQIRADGIAEQAHALGGGFDLDVLDGVRAAIVVRAEEGYVGVGLATTVVFIYHVADGGEQVVGVVIFRRRVQIVALYPVAPGLIAEPALVPVYRVAVAAKIGILGDVAVGIVAGENGVGGAPCVVVPVQVLQLAHGPHLIGAALRRAGLGAVGGRAADAVQTDGIGEERTHRILGTVLGAGALIAQRPCAVGIHGGQVHRAGGIGHEPVVRHLCLQRAGRRGVGRAQVAVGGHIEPHRVRQAAGLEEVAVAVLRHHAAVVVLDAQCAAGKGHAVVCADVAQVVAGVAALLPLPVEHAHRADVLLHRPCAVVYGAADAIPHHGGVGVHRFRTAAGDFGKAVQALALQPFSRNGRLGRVGAEAVVGYVVGIQRVVVGVCAAVQIVALGRAAAGAGQAVYLRLTGGGQGRGAVAVGQCTAGVFTGEAAQPHRAVAHVQRLQHTQRVAGLDAAAGVAAGKPAGVDGGIVGGYLHQGAVGFAGEDAPAVGLVVQVAAHQAAHIDCAVLIGQYAHAAAEAVVGHGTVADRAVVPPGQHTHVDDGGAALDQPAALHALRPRGQQRHVPHRTRGRDHGEHAHVVPRAHEGHALDGVVVAVVGGPEAAGVAHIRRVCRAVDRLLAGDGIGGTGVCSPPIGGVVNIPLLPERGVHRGRGKVVVMAAQLVQMARRPQIDRAGNAVRAAAGGHCLGKVGVELVRAPVDAHAVVEVRGGGICAGGQHIYRVQIIGRPTVGTGEVRGSSSIESLGFAAIRHRKCTAQRRGQGHGVAIADDSLVIGQIVHVAAEEARRGVLIPLIVHQRLGLKLRLPVAVVVHSRQQRIGVGAQTLAQQVVGHSGVRAGGGEGGAVQCCQERCGAHLRIGQALGCPGKAVDAPSVQAAGQVEYRADIRGSPFRRGGVYDLGRAGEGAGAVRAVRVGQPPGHKACCCIGGHLVSGGIAISERQTANAAGRAHQPSGRWRGEVAVGVGPADADSALRVAHQAGGGGAAFNNSGSKGVLNS